MSTFPYCILVFFFLHQRKVSAASETNGSKPGNKEDRSQQNMKCAGLGPRDCSDIRAMGFNASGVYPVYAGGDARRMQVDVYCDFNFINDSWMVFQRRQDGSENFERTYAEYAKGFGSLSGEFWAGNELLNLVTTNGRYKLRIELEDFEGQKRYAEYTTFAVDSSKDFYRLTVDGYSGNAGDSMVFHNKMRFSAMDIDNDGSSYHCAKVYRGAWWYAYCHRANLNGRYLRGPHQSDADGVEWVNWHGINYSLKKTEMKLAPLRD